jgi:hypothetical protein
MLPVQGAAAALVAPLAGARAVVHAARGCFVRRHVVPRSINSPCSPNPWCAEFDARRGPSGAALLSSCALCARDAAASAVGGCPVLLRAESLDVKPLVERPDPGAFPLNPSPYPLRAVIRSPPSCLVPRPEQPPPFPHNTAPRTPRPRRLASSAALDAHTFTFGLPLDPPQLPLMHTHSPTNARGSA